MTRRRGEAVKGPASVLMAAVLLIISPAFSIAVELWHVAYDSALKAIAAGDWATAETKLKIAKEAGPAPSRRVRAYGTVFVNMYVPDYYLGVVYLNQGRFEDALNEFKVVEASGLIREGDEEFAKMARLGSLARERRRPEAAEPQVVSTSRTGLKPEVARTGPTPDGFFYQAYDQALRAIADGRWDEAEAKLTTAILLDPTPAKFKRTYGAFRITYIPDYYLAVVYFNQGRFRDAMNQCLVVKANGVVAEGDEEFAEMTKLVSQANARLGSTDPAQ